MPLLDHFHLPLKEERQWGSMHSPWANAIVGARLELNMAPNGPPGTPISIMSNLCNETSLQFDSFRLDAVRSNKLGCRLLFPR